MRFPSQHPPLLVMIQPVIIFSFSFLLPICYIYFFGFRRLTSIICKVPFKKWEKLYGFYCEIFGHTSPFARQRETVLRDSLPLGIDFLPGRRKSCLYKLHVFQKRYKILKNSQNIRKMFTIRSQFGAVSPISGQKEKALSPRRRRFLL